MLLHKNKWNEKENEPGVEKYKEFLKRTQNQCKSLEKEVKETKEKFEIKVNEERVKRMEIEEKYGRMVRDKKNYEDKERILLNIFDTLKQINDDNSNSVKSRSNEIEESNVIDITD